MKIVNNIIKAFKESFLSSVSFPLRLSFFFFLPPMNFYVEMKCLIKLNLKIKIIKGNIVLGIRSTGDASLYVLRFSDAFCGEGVFEG